jgi:CheY-like chemotaxis protein
MATADFDMYRAKVLVAINDMSEAEPIAQCLEDQGYIVAFENDGITVMDILHSGNYDCLVVQNDLFVKNAKEITSVVRDRERTERKKATRKMAMEARNRNQTSILNPHNNDPAAKPKASHPNQVKSLPILVYTEKVAPDDLKSYMEAGMDGCLSRPFDSDALLTTLRQAVPKHMKQREEAVAQDKAIRYKNKSFTLNSRPTNDGSSDLIAKTLAMSASFSNNEGAVNGVLQFDADTVFPYTVMDSSIDAAGQAGRTKQKAPFFNLVVCHDLFDTSERMKIFLRPLSRRYPGLQILLWNYPGQAFTTFREEQLLNNEFHAQCLNSLFHHVGPEGTGQFDTDKPFYILGYGNGGNIASFYSAFYNDQIGKVRRRGCYVSCCAVLTRPRSRSAP